MREREQPKQIRELSKPDFMLALDKLWDYWTAHVEEGEFNLHAISKLATKALAFDADENFNVKYLMDSKGELFIKIMKKGVMGYGKGKTPNKGGIDKQVDADK